jgi:D-serine deaminase-like pyridoxal phosphate-dependent protein
METSMKSPPDQPSSEKPPHLALAFDLIGEPGSRHRIPTPAAVLDLDAFERNVDRMQSRADAAGLQLRPHTKAHKCAVLARAQTGRGAVGICCTKLAEAEAMAAAGLGAILVTSPIQGVDNAQRAARLAASLPDFRIVVDHADGVAELAAAATGPMKLLIDVDVGFGRTGVHSPGQAAEVARAVAGHPNLILLGLQGYGGGWQHMQGTVARGDAVAHGMTRLTAAVAAVQGVSGPVAVVTGGGTGTFTADASQGVLTEVQPGSYAFMDWEYRSCLGDDPDGEFEQSLAIVSSVISINHPEWVTLDAGLKALSTDGPEPRAQTEKFADCAFRFFGDEHGKLTRPGATVNRGERVALIPGHIDPTMDRYEVLHMVRGDTLVDIVKVEGRGRSQ